MTLYSIRSMRGIRRAEPVSKRSCLRSPAGWKHCRNRGRFWRVYNSEWFAFVLCNSYGSRFRNINSITYLGKCISFYYLGRQTHQAQGVLGCSWALFRRSGTDQSKEQCSCRNAPIIARFEQELAQWWWGGFTGLRGGFKVEFPPHCDIHPSGSLLDETK